MRLITTLLLFLLAVPAAAQEREIRSANLPRSLEREVLAMFDGGAERIDGPWTLESDRVHHGGLAAVGGPLTIAGRVDGDVAVVGGDVILEAGASVTGRITTVGGEVRMAPDVAVGGTISSYDASSRWGRDDADDRDDRDADDRGDWWRPRWRDHDGGYSRFAVRVGSGYNRVEGLPIMFGPVIRTEGETPLRIEALGIWRSEAGDLDTDRMGYRVEAEQFLAGDERLGIGASAYSVIEPLDRWQLSDTEASLGAVLFHDDYRDYYDRTGWSAFLSFMPTRDLEARIEYRSEEHAYAAAGDPWTLFDGDDRWRPQPLVGEGDVQSLVGSIELDLRDDEEHPYRGWYARASLERPLELDLVRPNVPLPLPEAGDLVAANEFNTTFTTAFLDLRRYSPVGRDAQLSFRVAAGGTLGDDALPPQFQHALGGLGTLPGFSTFHLDCGARAGAGAVDGAPAYLAYGCDRFFLGQAEYRGDLSLYFGLGDPDYDDDDWWDDVEIDLEPSWVVFVDAGQGWSAGAGSAGVAHADTDLLFDAGVGLQLDDLGVYLALPLNGDVDQEPRFFIRLGRRF